MEVHVLLLYRTFLFCALPMGLIAQTLDEDISILLRHPITSLESTSTIRVFCKTPSSVEFFKASMQNNRFIYDQVDNSTTAGNTITFTNETSYYATTLSLFPSDTKGGVYRVTVRKDSTTTNITVIVPYPSLEVETTVLPYFVLSAGAQLSLTTRTTDLLAESDALFRWHLNGKAFSKNDFSGLSFSKEGVSPEDEGVYECFRSGQYVSNRHSAMNVIVRYCEQGRWGMSDCEQVCPLCENGGICSDATGTCLCPPGFSGIHCGTAHGRNVFGRNGEYKCNESGDDNDDGCRGAIICHPHPFGCSCPAGYTGVSCDEDCPDEFYGANCNQECSCSGVACAKDTGVCPDIEEKATDPPDCPDGFYGANCNQECSCSGVACAKDTGLCPDIEEKATDPPEYRNSDILTFSEISSTSMTVTWPSWREDIDEGDGIVTSYIIRFRKKGAGSTFTPINKGLTLTHTFENLEEDTIYEFRVAIVGTNNVTGSASTIQPRRTLCSEIPSPCLVETSRTSRTATFDVQIPPLEQLTCSRWSYRISLQMMQQSGGWQEEREIHRSDLTTVTVQDLLPCTSYSFRIVISTDSSPRTEIASEIIQVTTREEAPDAVRNLQIISGTAGALSISWDEPDQVNNPCGISKYILSYKLVRHKACNQDETGEQAIDKQLTIMETVLDNLEDYADYDISVTAVSPSDLPGRTTTQRRSTESAEPSGEISSVRLYGITANSIRFSWSALTCRDYNGPNFFYQLRLFERTGNTHERAYEDSITGNSILIGDLKSCWNYQLWVRPENDFHAGQARYSTIVQTRSADLGPVENVAVLQTSHGLSVTWQPPATTSNICPVNYYTLQYTVHRYMSCPSYTLNGEQREIRIPVGTQWDLTELTPFTLYRIRVAADSGTFSEPEYGTTAKQAPSMAPAVSTDVAQSSSRSLVFTWRPIACEHLNGNFRYYNIMHNGTTANELPIDDESTDRYTLTGLTPCRTYEFNIQVVNNVGNGPFGSAVVKTREERPGSSFRLKLRATSAGTISAEWKRPHTHPCTISSQTIFIEMLDRDEDCFEDLDRSKSHSISSGIRSYLFTNLSPNSLYRISLRAENSAGLGDLSSEEERTNESRPTLPPEKVEVGRTSSTHIKFVWNKPPCGSHNGDIIRYNCRLRKKGEISNRTSSSKRVEFHNLVPFTNYSFEVSAVTAIGEGPYSLPLWIRTNESYPPPPSQLEVIFSNTSTILIMWEIPNPPHGIILGYEIFVHLADRRVGNYSNKLSVGSSETSNPPTALITDLQANASYSIQVRAKTRVGPGNWSEPLMQISEEGRPGPPSNVNFMERTLTTIKVEWDEPLQTNGQIIIYKIRTRAVEKSYIDDFRPGEFTSNIHQDIQKHVVYEIASLKPSTVYEIEISACTSAGIGDIVILTERTELTTDLQPVKQMLITSERKDTTAIITIPALTQTYATGYFVRVKHTGNPRRDTGYLPGYEDNPYDYVTAEVDKSDEETEFTIGDNGTYGRYHNAPLKADREYQVFVAPFTTASGEVFVCEWSEPVVISVSQQHQRLTIIMPLAILSILTVIMMLVMLCLYLRRYADKKRKRERASKNSQVALDLQTDQSSYIPLRRTQKPITAYQELNMGYTTYVTVEDTLTEKRPEESDHSANLTLEYNPEMPRCLENMEVHEMCSTYSDPPQHGYSTSIFATFATPESEEYETPLRKGIDTDVKDYGEDCDLSNQFRNHKKAVRLATIKISDLPKQLQNKQFNTDDTLMDEFKAQPNEKMFPSTVAEVYDVGSSVLPYDHSRVKLQVDKEEESKYYNASFIKTSHNTKVIAAKGPGEGGGETFWRMVWQEKVEIIVNLSAAVELDAQYWPSEFEMRKMCGKFLIIWCQTLDESLHYILSQLKLIKGEKVQEVTMCHFLTWPNDTIPVHSVSVISFIERVKCVRRKTSAPVMVHCRDGAGATGTFITLFSLMDDCYKKSRIAVFDFVKAMRKFRPNMVQREDQYLFVYEVLALILWTLHSALTVSEVKKMDFNQLNDRMNEEFQTLQKLKSIAAPRQSSEGLADLNIGKNRNPEIFPLDVNRIILKSPGMQGGNGYINASFIDKFSLKQGVITTQLPLPSTVEDFWRMVYDYNVATTVLLADITDSSVKSMMTSHVWPEHDKSQYGNLRVTCFGETVMNSGYSYRKFLVRHLLYNKELSTDLYQLTKWDNHSGILNMLVKLQPVMESGECLTVVCLDGATRCGVFVAALNQIKQLQQKERVNVLKTVYTLNQQRPHMIQNLMDYRLCYQLIKESLNSEECEYMELE